MTFAEKMKDMIDKGVVASRDLAKKASEKAKELGAKGVLKLEIAQLESQAEKLVAKLGAEVYASLVDRKAATREPRQPGRRGRPEGDRRSARLDREEGKGVRRLG